ncbi:hypothetical protein ACFE04_011021 [Oxalis oulophora]
MFASNYNDPFDSNKQLEDIPLSLFHFPSPFSTYELGLDDQENYIYNQQNDQEPSRVDHDHSLESESIIINMEDSNKTVDMKNGLSSPNKKRNKNITNHKKIPRKRSPKSDRHSKINTAQGMRDRRMRLSLEVARDFFWLQDLLGYDKASKTVEWLIRQSKPEILKLEKDCRTQTMNNYTSTSKCEVLNSTKLHMKAKTRKLRKADSHNAIAKDLRQKARLRARERTIEKVWRNESNAKNYQIEMNYQISCCSPGGESAGNHSQNMKPYGSLEEPVSSLKRIVSEQSEIYQEIEDDDEPLKKHWSTTPYSNIRNCLYNQAPNISLENPFGDVFQIIGKPWEEYNTTTTKTYDDFQSVGERLGRADSGWAGQIVGGQWTAAGQRGFS